MWPGEAGIYGLGGESYGRSGGCTFEEEDAQWELVCWPSCIVYWYTIKKEVVCKEERRK
jgi:hypothetical protein